MKPNNNKVAPSLMDLTSGQALSYTVGALYLASTPISVYISKTNFFSNLILPKVFNLLSITNPSKHIIGLGGLYFLIAYPIGAGLSIRGQSIQGYSNRDPRSNQINLIGLARRLVSTHHNLMETFPAFAFVAVMSQILAPNSIEIKNLLGLHVLLKTIVFPLAYITDFDLIRSTSHILSIGSICGVLIRLIYS